MELEEVWEEIENRDSISNSDKDSDVESAQPNFNNRKTLKVPPVIFVSLYMILGFSKKQAFIFCKTAT